MQILTLHFNSLRYNACFIFIYTYTWKLPRLGSGREPACSSRRHKRHGFIPGLGRLPGGGHGNKNPWDSCLENPMDRETWRATVYRVAMSQILLKRFSGQAHSHKGEAAFWASLMLSGKKSTCSAGTSGDGGSLLGLERSPGGRKGNPLQYSCLGNPMDRGAWGGYGPRGCKELDTTEVT